LPLYCKILGFGELAYVSGKNAGFLTNRILQFIEARFKDGQYSTSAQACTPSSKTKRT
jgi:hypothetical protein